MIAEAQVIERLLDHTIAQKRIYYGVPWETYLRLLDELGEGSHLRVTYVEGVIEVMSPKSKHERLSRLIDTVVMQYALAAGLDFLNCGSLTMRIAVAARGGEPDSSYYILSEPLVRGVDDIDLAIHPPPDIVLEIDITNPSLDKFGLYVALGVPEVWRYDGTRIIFHQLTPDGYAPITHSVSFPNLSSELLTRFLHTGQTDGTNAMLQSVQAALAAS